MPFSLEPYLSNVWVRLLAALGGLLLLLWQLAKTHFLESIREQRKAIREVSSGLLYYAPWYANPGTGKQEDMRAASDALRQKAIALKTVTDDIPWAYDVLSRISFGRLFLPRESVKMAFDNLIGLSNSIFQGHEAENLERREIIRKSLRLRSDGLQAAAVKVVEAAPSSAPDLPMDFNTFNRHIVPALLRDGWEVKAPRPEKLWAMQQDGWQGIHWSDKHGRVGRLVIVRTGGGIDLIPLRRRKQPPQ